MSVNEVANIEPLYWINSALVLVVSIVAFFLKRVISSIDKMETKVQELDKTVGILLDRDRRTRIRDYQATGDFTP